MASATPSLTPTVMAQVTDRKPGSFMGRLLGGAGRPEKTVTDETSASARSTPICQAIEEEGLLSTINERSQSETHANKAMMKFFERLVGSGKRNKDKGNISLTIRGRTIVKESNLSLKIGRFCAKIGYIFAGPAAHAKMQNYFPPVSGALNILGIITAVAMRAIVFLAVKIAELVIGAIILTAMTAAFIVKEAGVVLAELGLCAVQALLVITGILALIGGYVLSALFGVIVNEINRGKHRSEQFRQPLSVARDFVFGGPRKELSESTLLKLMVFVGLGMGEVSTYFGKFFDKYKSDVKALTSKQEISCCRESFESVEPSSKATIVQMEDADSRESKRPASENDEPVEGSSGARAAAISETEHEPAVEGFVSTRVHTYESLTEAAKKAASSLD